MSKRRDTEHADLFGAEAGAGPTLATPVPEDFVQRIRDELHRTLALVTAATELPWSTPTRACLAEMRFHSIATWLPKAEADILRRRFDAELIRIYGPDAEADATD